MKSNNLRIRIISVGIVLVALVFVGKLYMLQIVEHSDFVMLADKQYTKSSGQTFNRGSIFFEGKDGESISAATLKIGFTVAINPKILADATSTFDKINAIIPIDRDVFLQKASKKNDPYEEVAKRVDPEKATAISNLKISGLSIYKDQWRFYPGGQTASNVLGFVAYKGDNLVGRYGLEKYYEDLLSRKQEDLYANFFVEVFSNIKKTVSSNSTLEGDLVATIEPTVQASLEDTISKIQNKWSSDATGGIIINPKNGEIYAMAVQPTFDPNNFQIEKKVSVYADPLVDQVREMGSIIKAITRASGLDAGVVKASSTYLDKGSVSANTETIYNWDKKGRGIINMQTVLNESLNTGAAYVEQRLGNEKFSNYMMNFGLGEKTGIDLPNEAQSIVTGLKSSRDIEHITASYGQGIALTPIATARALSVLANGGTLITPHIVKKIEYKIGTFKNINPPPGKRVISEQASHEITRMLVQVLDTSLLNGKAKNPHYSIATKTGTAQIAEQGKGYYSDRYLHSFFGYFPAYNPKFLVLLYTVYPKNISFAANTLAQPFLDLSKFLINYYNVPPDR